MNTTQGLTVDELDRQLATELPGREMMQTIFVGISAGVGITVVGLPGLPGLPVCPPLPVP
jgi:hypothetical protein